MRKTKEVALAMPKGAVFTDEHKEKIMESRRKSEAWKDGRLRAAEKLRGRQPSLESIAGSLATRFLRDRGLKRGDFPELWEEYRDMFLQRLRRIREAELAA